MSLSLGLCKRLSGKSRKSNIFLLLPLKRLHKPKERDVAFLCIDYKFSTEESQEKILSRATSASFQKMQQKTAKSTVAASRYLGGHATIHLPLPLRDYKSKRGAGDLSIYYIWKGDFQDFCLIMSTGYIFFL